jgi:hypothetical protein
MRRLDEILDVLDRFHQRASYGAVAGLVGAIPRAVMAGRPRDWRHSWVVNEETGRPTSFSPPSIHPAIAERSEIIVRSDELNKWLENPV